MTVNVFPVIGFGATSKLGMVGSSSSEVATHPASFDTEIYPELAITVLSVLLMTLMTIESLLIEGGVKPNTLDHGSTPFAAEIFSHAPPAFEYWTSNLELARFLYVHAITKRLLAQSVSPPLGLINVNSSLPMENGPVCDTRDILLASAMRIQHFSASIFGIANV